MEYILYFWLWTDLPRYSALSIADLEQMNTDWVDLYSVFIKTNQWFFRSLTIVVIFQSNFFFQVRLFYLYSKYVSFPFRFFTLIFEQYVKVDVKALRAFRVLRPLRLVSGVPSKLTFYYQNKTAVMVFPFNSYFRFFRDLVFNQSKYTKLRPKTRVRGLPNV